MGKLIEMSSSIRDSTRLDHCCLSWNEMWKIENSPQGVSHSEIFIMMKNSQN